MINQNSPQKRAKMSKFSHNSAPLRLFLDKDDEYLKTSNAIICLLMNGGHKISQLSESLRIPQRTIQRYMGQISRLHGTSASGEQVPVIRKNGLYWHTSPIGLYLWGCFVIDAGYELRIDTAGSSPGMKHDIEIVFRAIVNEMSDCGSKYVPAWLE